MEKTDLELINQLRVEDPVLSHLWREHLDLEERLSKLENKHYLNIDEQQERNRIKKLKLAGRDRIEEILRSHRN